MKLSKNHQEDSVNSIMSNNQASKVKNFFIYVEGKTDLKIYQQILELKKINSQYQKIIVEPVNKMSAEDTGGRSKVIKKIKRINEKAKSKKKYALGIIDKDVDDYKRTYQEDTATHEDKAIHEELPSNIYTLKYYSIESYYVSQERVESIINLFNKQIPTEQRCFDSETVFGNIKNKYIFNDFFYFSLAALKGHIKCEPNPLITYNNMPSSINHDHISNLKKQVMASQEQLDSLDVNWESKIP
jgi:hypothetical protein